MNNQYLPPSEIPAGACVWAYCRDNGAQPQEQNVDRQQNEIAAYCRQHNLVLSAIFRDVAQSGNKVNGCAGFQSMIKLSEDKANCPKAILVLNFERFTRNLDHFVTYVDVLHKRGIFVHSISNPIQNSHVASGDLYSHMVDVMVDVCNEERNRQISCDTKRGLAAKTRAGYVPGGVPPRGYRAVREIVSSHRHRTPRISTKWKIDPKTGPLVTSAFEMRAGGKSIKEIMKSPCGGLYKTKGCWDRFFANKSYLGIGKCGEIEVANHHPALVDPETWEAVQKLREQVRKNRSL